MTISLTKSTRESNFELLRIVSMLMVLNVHSFWGVETLTYDSLSIKIILDYFRESLSISCVNLFILISGYFSIKWKFKNIFSLIFQVYFYVMLIYAILLMANLVNFEAKSFFLKLNALTNQYWFITAYIGLYVLSPLLNKFTENVSKNELLFFIIIFYILQTYFQLLQNNTFQSGYSILSFCGLYLIGRYIKITNCQLSHKRSLIVEFIILISITFLIMLEVILSMIIFNKSTLDLKMNYITGFIYNNPLIIIQSIVIFLIFKKITFKNKFINYCASSSLAIYLLHMHPDIKPYFYNFTESLYTQPFELHMSILVVLFLIIFTTAILIDKIRIFIFEILYPKFEYCINKIEKCIQQQ